MCGIFAAFLNRPLSEHDILSGRAATNEMSHRGPDAFGEYYDQQQGVYFGHRRLKIIDLTEGGAQPMVRGSVAINYNGEAYNYRSLRERLITSGMQFSSSSDTEVVLAAWQMWGERAFDRIDGMFGLAIWDGERGWLAVDRYGEKQLYFTTTSDGLFVSSEIAPLAKLVGAREDLTGDKLFSFMSFGFTGTSTTAYEGIHRLPPATLVSVDQGRINVPRNYWQPEVSHPGSGSVQPVSDEQIDRLRDALIDSISGRLESDAPICLFLSTGTDSALTAALISRELGKQVPTITVGFPQHSDHDESELAAKISGHLNLPHEQVESTDDDDSYGPDYFIELFGQPNDNLTAASVRKLARSAAGLGYRAAVTGLGGDEVFLGYKKHLFVHQHRHLYGLPEPVRLAATFLFDYLPFNGRKIDSYRNTIGLPDNELYVALKNIPAINAFHILPDFKKWCDSLRDFNTGAFIEQVTTRELVDAMAGSHLPAFDIGSMREGFELRTPYLNNDIQKFVSSCDARSLTAFGSKYMLRRLLRRYLPSDMVDHPKRSFRFPLRRITARYKLERILRTNMFPRDFVEAIWAKRHSGSWERLALRLILAVEFMAGAQAPAGAKTDLGLNPSPR